MPRLLEVEERLDAMSKSQELLNLRLQTVKNHQRYVLKSRSYPVTVFLCDLFFKEKWPLMGTIEGLKEENF